MPFDYKETKKGALKGLKAYGRGKLGEDLKGLSGSNPGDTLDGQPLDEAELAPAGVDAQDSDIAEGGDERMSPSMLQEATEGSLGASAGDTSEKTQDIGGVELSVEASPVPGVEDAALDNLPPEEIERLLASLGGQ